MDVLIRHAFATMICFQNLFNDLESSKEQEEYSEIPETIRNAWDKANKMRAWEHKVYDDLKLELQSTIVEEFKKEYAEEHPSQPALEGKLSEDH